MRLNLKIVNCISDINWRIEILNLMFDPSAPGLSKVYKDYQILVMRVLWEGEGVAAYLKLTSE